MALTAQSSIFGFGPQTAKGVAATTFYRHKALNIGFGVNDDARLGPLEIGSSPFPTFPYKAGYVVGGPVSIIPRMQESFGWLLMALMGDSASQQVLTGGTPQVETATVAGTITEPGTVEVIVTAAGLAGSPVTYLFAVADNDTAAQVAGKIRAGLTVQPALTDMFTVSGTTTAVILTRNIAAADDATLNIAVDNGTCVGITPAATSTDTTAGVAGTGSGVYDHSFRPATDASLVKWLSLKKYFPPTDGDAATDVGETFTDVKPVGMALTVETDQPIQAQFDFLGCTYAMTGDISGWTWDNTYEGWESIPVGCVVGGGITFTGGGLTNYTLPAVRATINVQNVPLDVREEKTIGTPGLPDVTIVERRVTFDVIVKFTHDLYMAILTGSTAGTEWTVTPFTGALSLVVKSSQNILGTSVPYQMQVSAPSVMWQMQGAPQLAAGRSVTLRFQGTALEPISGHYFTMKMRNIETSYTWPT